MNYSDLSIPELLAEEEKTQARRNLNPRNSNTWRQCDARIDGILAELNRRAQQLETMH